jgi:hypothetical protein
MRDQAERALWSEFNTEMEQSALRSPAYPMGCPWGCDPPQWRAPTHYRSEEVLEIRMRMGLIATALALWFTAEHHAARKLAISRFSRCSALTENELTMYPPGSCAQSWSAWNRTPVLYMACRSAGW